MKWGIIMNLKNHIVSKVLIIYILCYFLRIVEYMIIRTDQTALGEAFIHKLLGILIMCISLHFFHMKLQQIGFVRKHIVKYLILGICFGLLVFALGYGIELLIHRLIGEQAELSLYVSSYAVDKNVGNSTALLIFIFCIVGNIINVVMEEGVFRGLFQKMLEQKYTFLRAALMVSVLFGMWHTMGPIRNFLDGSRSIQGTIAYMLMLGITSGLIGFKFTLMSKMEGALYMGMGDHFVNNTIVNLLHVVTKNGVDEWMFLRITIAQTVSFLIVLMVYLYKKKKDTSGGIL